MKIWGSAKYLKVVNKQNYSLEKKKSGSEENENKYMKQDLREYLVPNLKRELQNAMQKKSKIIEGTKETANKKNEEEKTLTFTDLQ